MSGPGSLHGCLHYRAPALARTLTLDPSTGPSPTLNLGQKPSFLNLWETPVV